MRVVIKKTAKPDLSPYNYETHQLTYIRSADRLLQLENGKLYQIEVKTGPEVKTLLGARPVTLVQMDYIKRDEAYQVTPNAMVEQIIKKIYKISPNSLVEYVIEIKPTATLSYICIPDLTQPVILNEVLKWLEIVYGKKDTL
jgi:hypothetical protein